MIEDGAGNVNAEAIRMEAKFTAVRMDELSQGVGGSRAHCRGWGGAVMETEGRSEKGKVGRAGAAARPCRR